MILLILLLMIAFGTGIFIIGRAIDRHEAKLCNEKYKSNRRNRSGRQIKKDLDWLVLLKQKDIIDEGQFCEQADKLIDELAETSYAR